MKILLLMIGKTSDAWLQEGVNQYFDRLIHYLPFEHKVLSDIKNAGKMKPDVLKQLEGEAILRVLDNTDRVVLLDEGGKQFSSRDFAGFIEKQMFCGSRRLVFIIGGAWGFSDEVYKRADSKISLSRMTFSHQMVRVIFAEQLYRAMTILKNEPYHHD